MCQIRTVAATASTWSESGKAVIGSDLVALAALDFWAVV
jgi:hypothetical protein